MFLRPGTVFAFLVEQKNKYGIIQVLHWGKAGYNVRVFYKLIDDLERKNVDSLVNTKDFYYIKDFYPFDFFNGKKVGHFAIPRFVSIPKYTRNCERKRNGDLWWYVVEESGNVKTYKAFDEKLKSLSPATSWGIQYIKKRWVDGFTLDNWHELEEKWYIEYLSAYEPSKFFQREKEEVIKHFSKKESITKEALKKLDVLLSNFAKELYKNKRDKLLVNKIIEKLTVELNEWNSLYNFIETEESEIILEFVGDLLLKNDCTEALDVIDVFREW